MSKQTASKNTANGFAFLVVGFFGSLSYLVAFMVLILAFTVDKSWVPVNEWGYVAAGVSGWLLGALLDLKMSSR